MKPVLKIVGSQKENAVAVVAKVSDMAEVSRKRRRDKMNEIRTLGTYKIETDSYQDIDLPLGELITSLIMKSSHSKCGVSLIINGNKAIFANIPVWLLERGWLPINLDTMRYNTVVLRIRNFSEQKKVKVDVWYARQNKDSS